MKIAIFFKKASGNRPVNQGKLPFFSNDTACCPPLFANTNDDQELTPK